MEPSEPSIQPRAKDATSADFVSAHDALIALVHAGKIRGAAFGDVKEVVADLIANERIRLLKSFEAPPGTLLEAGVAHTQRHPVIDGMFDLLPPAGSDWPYPQRNDWLSALGIILSIVYREKPARLHDGQHDWVAMNNEVIESGEFCISCYRAGGPVPVRPVEPKD